MEWFKNTFLKSFKEGETQISEKQFWIFCKYLTTSFETDYTYGYIDTIDGLKIKAYEWACKGGARYYVEIKRVEQ